MHYLVYTQVQRFVMETEARPTNLATLQEEAELKMQEETTVSEQPRAPHMLRGDHSMANSYMFPPTWKSHTSINTADFGLLYAACTEPCYGAD